jgi:hypothetical protein
LWKYFRKLLFGVLNSNSEQKITLKVNNVLANDPIIIADTFNSYFCNIGNELASALPKTDYEFPVNLTYLSTISSYDLTNEEEIMSIINGLDSVKSAGLDSISVKFVKKNNKHMIVTYLVT